MKKLPLKPYPKKRWLIRSHLRLQLARWPAPVMFWPRRQRHPRIP
ncbi:hypothetical protein VQ056_01610 [Paenibacillus sp. JTLBN-2024]